MKRSYFEEGILRSVGWVRHGPRHEHSQGLQVCNNYLPSTLTNLRHEESHISLLGRTGGRDVFQTAITEDLVADASMTSNTSASPTSGSALSTSTTTFYATPTNSPTKTTATPMSATSATSTAGSTSWS
ncbi:hypothetical protein Nepgr_010470 [Nepenthes gracilis]|uniref:Uncharacterized protein n=1 Tax=Nepenthes gracilis TaxID=150966 RepID=A0AAD3SCI2_NEPGR|nr:hypothetical protein Nepgr_010470 [Nepenthes gracilis]